MDSEQIEQTLIKTFATLQKLRHAEETGTMYGDAGAGEVPVAGMQPRDSIRDDKVTCLECGREMRQLTRGHLRSHGLTSPEYKRKWGFALKQPLSAKSLTKARSRNAKKKGLPENLIKYLESKRREKAQAAAEKQVPQSKKPGRVMVKRRPKAQ
jgi:predicted transcriptional regulator